MVNTKGKKNKKDRDDVWGVVKQSWGLASRTHYRGLQKCKLSSLIEIILYSIKYQEDEVSFALNYMTPIIFPMDILALT